jgi:hypothetical protein
MSIRVSNRNEPQMPRFIKHVLVIVTVAAVGLATVSAHQITVRGTVAGIDRTRIQVKTGKEKANETIPWYPMDANTKFFRGKTVLGFDAAKTVVGERVVINVDHQNDGKVRTIDVRLPAK